MPGRRVRWGWHRLSDHYAARIVADAGIGSGDLVLDVGAGTGAITGQLLRRGARVVAVELHPGRAAELRRRHGGRHRGGRLVVVVADASRLRLPRRPFRVVANPPFAVSSAVLRRLVAPGSALVRADVVVPWHTGRRWAAGRAPGAGRWLRIFDVSVGAPLPRTAFSPPPPNGVELLVIRRRPQVLDIRSAVRAQARLARRPVRSSASR